ncbi:MAG: hypothetical protein ACRCYN_01455 [Plesiomonas sp.]
MAINKQEWAEIERTIKCGFSVNFTYQQHAITVFKIQLNETKMVYVVGADGRLLCGGDTDDKAKQLLTTLFLRRKQINPHARLVAEINRKRGGKSFLKRKENRYLLESRVEVTELTFPTARTVVTHFRKIAGLELASPLPLPDTTEA